MQAATHDPKAAEPFNEAGKAAFSNSEFEKAIENFTKAIELNGKSELTFSNRAAASTSLARITRDEAAANALLLSAVEDADRAIALNKRFIKAYARKATALYNLKKFTEAKATFNLGLDLDPTDKGLHDGIAAVDKAIAAAKKKKRDAKTKTEEESDVVIGIDLGTTYSCVTYWKDDKVIIIPNSQGQMVTPSYVSFSKGKRVVGLPAKMDAPRNPKNTVFDVKRIIGLTLEDNGVKEDVKRYPFGIVEREAGTNKPGIRVEVDSGDYHVFAPEEISAFVLGYLKKCAEDYLKVPVTKAVITVPAYFNDAQRAATKTAGALAGLDVLRIINEPTAAALAYGLDKQSLNAHDPTKEETPAETVLIFDLGGGTFDVSVLVISDGVFEVKSTGGDTRLGGEDIDHAVGDALFREMIDNLGFPANIKEDERAFKRVMSAIEKAKRELSQVDETEINIEALVARDGDVDAKDFVYKFTREEFERLTKPIYVRCIETVKRVIKDAGLGPEQINDIVLVGGSTRVPKIQSMLSEFFGGKSLCKSLNPDEAVAYGAAVQGAILSGKRTKKGDLLLLDVAPLSLGIETVGRIMSVVIPRNTPIPCTRTEIYTTETDFQTEVDVSVYEGERHKTTDNHLLGEFNISGIESAKKGEPKIDVQFSIDSNGILTVTAKDQRTGAKADIEIARGSRASPEEVARMTADAARYRKQDEDNARVLSLRNDLEQKIYTAQDNAEAMFNSSKKGAADRDAKNLLAKATEAEGLLHGGENLSVEQLSKLIGELALLTKKISSKR